MNVSTKDSENMHEGSTKHECFNCHKKLYELSKKCLFVVIVVFS